MSKHIVIVGGGYLGAQLAQSLDDDAKVTLIEARSHFVHASAMIRCLVQPDILDRLLLRYDDLLENGDVVQGRVSAVDGQGVTLTDGRRIEADYIVLATGSSNGVPFKPASDDIAAFRDAVQEVNDQLKAARRVVIVGAGPVGIELAGEIKDFMPETEVTLIVSDSSLMPAKPSALGRKLRALLGRYNVNVMFDVRAENLKHTSKPYAGTVTLSNGVTLEADMIIPAVGGTPNADLFEGLPGVETTEKGRIKVDGWLRPSKLPNVFAAGDVADPGGNDGMTIVALTRQLPWLAKILKGVVDGKAVEDMRRYRPWKEAPIFLSLGPKRGASFLGLFTVGSLTTSLMKGAHLFIKRYELIFGK